MKNIIVILFSMMLGVYIFTSTLSENDSVRSSGSDVMKAQVELMKTSP
tara:strand:- start:176 stop:319 length:144 start_codon:yes stop_codon:yes gene_type:complete